MSDRDLEELREQAEAERKAMVRVITYTDLFLEGEIDKRRLRKEFDRYRGKIRFLLPKPVQNDHHVDRERGT